MTEITCLGLIGYDYTVISLQKVFDTFNPIDLIANLCCLTALEGGEQLMMTE